jgi:hypothetical protein
MTHTPEPWEVREPNGPGNGFLIEADGPWPRLPGAWIGSRTRDAAQLANVRLMIAAPKLLRLLRRLYDLQNGPPLEKYRDEWEEVMGEVGSVIAEVEEVVV